MRVYPSIFKLFFSKMDAEKAHHFAFAFIRGLGKAPWLLSSCTKPDSKLAVKTMGLTFPSPFGLAAGFDKNAEAITGLAALGFGHVEVGTLTAHAQEGNPKPRLFRLIDDLALVNRMGFNNNGSEAAVAPLQRARIRKTKPIIGVNIGKSKVTPVEDAIDDYVLSAERLGALADYIAVNVSSPNTPGLRGLQEIDQLRPLLEAVVATAKTTPVLVKIAPDMDDEQIDGIVDLTVELGLAGIIATNTTVERNNLQADKTRVTEIGAGGLSGAPLAARSLQVLQRIKSRAPESLCIISVGGVSSSADVIERINAGATLVQGYSAFIYEGPLWAAKINRDLARHFTARLPRLN